MKLLGGLCLEIADYENVRLAFTKAARGKQGRSDVVAFKRRFDANIAGVQAQLQRRQLDVGHYRFFYVFDDSDACRKNKGAQKAVWRAQAFARRFPWYLKLDIRHYFDNIDHGCAMAMLGRRFKDRGVLDMFRQIVATYETASGAGMPIGNLISQHVANFYLSGFDHWMKETLQIKGYIRYMDDLLVFGADKQALKQVHLQMRDYLARRLKLTLKSDFQLNRCIRGIPFLGYVVFPFRIRLSDRSKKRFRNKFRQYEAKYKQGLWRIDDLVRHMQPLAAFTQMADAAAFRRRIIQRFGVSF